ncbi:hypothetical protein [Rhizobium leguminosarum]|nr:hypothetical protein [Rhizobium leguminosarum]
MSFHRTSRRNRGGVPAGRDLLDDEKPVAGRLDLEGYGCAIIELAG